MIDKFVIKINGLYYAGESEETIDEYAPVWGTGSFIVFRSNGQCLTRPKFSPKREEAKLILGFVNIESTFKNLMLKIRDADSIEILKVTGGGEGE